MKDEGWWTLEMRGDRWGMNQNIRGEVGREIKGWKARDESTKGMRDLGCEIRDLSRGISRKIRGDVGREIMGWKAGDEAKAMRDLGFEMRGLEIRNERPGKIDKGWETRS
jgi:hypothetical protein